MARAGRAGVGGRVGRGDLRDVGEGGGREVEKAPGQRELQPVGQGVGELQEALGELQLEGRHVGRREARQVDAAARLDAWGAAREV